MKTTTTRTKTARGGTLPSNIGLSKVIAVDTDMHRSFSAALRREIARHNMSHPKFGLWLGLHRDAIDNVLRKGGSPRTWKNIARALKTKQSEAQ